MISGVSALMVVLPVVAATQATAGEAGRKPLYVQPLGGCSGPGIDTDRVVEALKEFYRIDVRVLDCVELPERAYYPPRRRYRAERLLDYLHRRLPADGWRILGLTAADISTTNGSYVDWGVLGLGELPGKASVISSFRCKRRAGDAIQAAERLAKVAVHEVGHTLGLDHCPTRGCLMEDAKGSVKTADREGDLCERCRRLLAGAGIHVPLTPRAPWRAPGVSWP